MCVTRAKRYQTPIMQNQKKTHYIYYLQNFTDNYGIEPVERNMLISHWKHCVRWWMIANHSKRYDVIERKEWRRAQQYNKKKYCGYKMKRGEKKKLLYNTPSQKRNTIIRSINDSEKYWSIHAIECQTQCFNTVRLCGHSIIDRIIYGSLCRYFSFHSTRSNRLLLVYLFFSLVYVRPHWMCALCCFFFIYISPEDFVPITFEYDSAASMVGSKFLPMWIKKPQIEKPEIRSDYTRKKK